MQNYFNKAKIKTGCRGSPWGMFVLGLEPNTVNDGRYRHRSTIHSGVFVSYGYNSSVRKIIFVDILTRTDVNSGSSPKICLQSSFFLSCY